MMKQRLTFQPVHSKCLKFSEGDVLQRRLSIELQSMSVEHRVGVWVQLPSPAGKLHSS